MCLHCRNQVSSASIVSGVINRNHCPYCLRSRHLDLYQAGDRLSACKAVMEPIGLTLKRTRKKYSPAGSGELMMIHICTACETISINRLAADDDLQRVKEVFFRSFRLSHLIRTRLESQGIVLLGEDKVDVVQRQLIFTATPVNCGEIMAV